VRRVAVLALGLALAGCGRATHIDAAAPQVLHLDWYETDAGLSYSVRSIALTADGWRVEASVANRRATAIDVVFPHQAGHTKFGLIVSTRRELPRTNQFAALRTPFFEQDERPPVPTTLGPGESWSGVFSGPGRPPQGAYLRVTFGRFVPPERPSDAFALVTRHVVRLER
jgi:hypothetical protein